MRSAQIGQSSYYSQWRCPLQVGSGGPEQAEEARRDPLWPVKGVLALTPHAPLIVISMSLMLLTHASGSSVQESHIRRFYIIPFTSLERNDSCALG